MGREEKREEWTPSRNSEQRDRERRREQAKEGGRDATMKLERKSTTGTKIARMPLDRTEKESHPFFFRRSIHIIVHLPSPSLLSPQRTLAQAPWFLSREVIAVEEKSKLGDRRSFELRECTTMLLPPLLASATAVLLCCCSRPTLLLEQSSEVEHFD
jgi:hypothetical protein